MRYVRLRKPTQHNPVRAVPVSYIIGNDKYGSCAALLRTDNGIKLCVVDVATPDCSFHILYNLHLDLGRNTLPM